MDSNAIQLRQLTIRDIPFGIELSTIAGWNQNQRDWKFFIETDPRGNYLATYQNQPAGTVATLPYQDAFCWIGLVLVHPDYRRRGIGKKLLNEAIYYAQHYGTVRLDATDEGRKLYKKLGFQDENTWVRMVRLPKTFSSTSSPCISSINNDHLTELNSWDTHTFGANRQKLLSHFHTYYPDLSYVFKEEEHIQGYCLGRKGRLYHQIGPLVAKRYEIAEQLLHRLLSQWGPFPIVIDTFTNNDKWMEILRESGFLPRRNLYRMYLGALENVGTPGFQFGLAGPEYG